MLHIAQYMIISSSLKAANIFMHMLPTLSLELFFSLECKDDVGRSFEFAFIIRVKFGFYYSWHF